MKNYNINLRNDFTDRKETDNFGLIIKHIDETLNQKHTGFIFSNFNECETTLAHLAFKNDYRLEKNKTTLDGYAVLWLDFIPERTAVPIKVELMALGISGDIKLPYGITNEGGTKFEQGSFVPNPLVRGDSLTCATFVLCVLEQFGFSVINRESWEHNDEDTKWQADIVEILEKYLQPYFHEIQKENIGKVIRIRPEQVVGACGIFDFSPVEYDEACKAGEDVIQKLIKLGC